MPEKTVNRYTRAGENGKKIKCPSCESVITVYHFSWTAIVCQSCNQPQIKQDWIVAEWRK